MNILQIVLPKFSILWPLTISLLSCWSFTNESRGHDVVQSSLKKTDVVAAAKVNRPRLTFLQEQSLSSDFIEDRWNRIGFNQSKLGLENKDIDYSLIAKDIVRLFKLMDTPDVTPLVLTNIIKGGDCVDGSTCSILLRDFSEADRNQGQRVFDGLLSKNYISSVEIFTDNSNYNKISSIEISLKDKYKNRFITSKLHSMLTNEKFVAKKGVKLGGCDGPCKGGQRKYVIDIKNKYFPNSSKLYEVEIIVNVKIIGGFNEKQKRYILGPEVLGSIRLELQKK